MTNVLPHDRSYRCTTKWDELFAADDRPFLQSDMVLLDVGTGLNPAIPPGRRPKDCTYIGLDFSAEEMKLTTRGACHGTSGGGVLLFQFYLDGSWVSGDDCDRGHSRGPSGTRAGYCGRLINHREQR